MILREGGYKQNNLKHTIMTQEKSKKIQYRQVSLKLDDKIRELQDLVELIPKKGITCKTCQRACIKEAINKLQAAANGLEEGDFEPNEYSGDFEYSYS